MAYDTDIDKNEARRLRKRETNAAWAAANPEKVKQSRRRWQQAHPEKAKKYCTDWRRKNSEKIQARNAEWDAKYPRRKREYAARHRSMQWAKCLVAKAAQNSLRRKHPRPTITAEWVEARFQEHPFCFYTGIALVPKSLRAIPRAPWMPSLDRIDNSAGYTPDNTRLTCWGWNCFRGNLSVEEALSFWHEFDEMRRGKVAA